MTLDSSLGLNCSTRKQKQKQKGGKKKPTTTDKNPNFYQHEDKIP